MKKIMFNDKYGLTQAVLEGRKTMTRRVISYPSKFRGQNVAGYYVCRKPSGELVEVCLHDEDERMIDAGQIFPNFQVGEVVAIAQSYKDSGYTPDSLDRHPKDLSIRGLMKDSAGWNNKMFVKSYACKHHIKITNIKVERLQEISDDDCLKEGIFEWNAGQKDIPFYSFSYADIPDYFSPRDAFADLIDKVSGKGTWEENPFVWVYEFKLFD
ncbi:hypothetical protein F3B53_00030 [Bacteroides ovatus]|uniref:ASCH domain-containing protein n=2 Tax=Bacteroides ovatus TaxID=28116 RepID=A0A6A1XR95_BACOV|nr:hypothetical protein F3B53_00030 [Bacteroides ovatus]MDC2394901.1 hypothetical protein [Bacteroides ovatus]MDC2481677.1 hypothetical protein [Bacteroides ovatus]